MHNEILNTLSYWRNVKHQPDLDHPQVVERTTASWLATNIMAPFKML